MKPLHAKKQTVPQTDDRLSLHDRLLVKLFLIYCLAPSRWEVTPPKPADLYDRLLTVIGEICGDVATEVIEALDAVSIAYGFLSFDQFVDWQQGAFLARLRRLKHTEGVSSVSLSSQEGALLHLLCIASHLPFNPTKVSFAFWEIEDKTPAAMKKTLHPHDY